MIAAFVRDVLAEDVGRGDLYERVLPSTPSSAKVIAKSSGIVAGQLYCDALAKMEALDLLWLKNDGEAFNAGEVLVELKADSHTLLRIERTFLNMLLHASSIATLTHRFVALVEPYGTKLLDTRKTRPMLRRFEKYATRIGGATNHRMGLDDALMLKDTHLKTIDDLDVFMKAARRKIPFTCKIEIEAETIEQAKRFMAVGADIVMCDNMSVVQIKEVIAYRNANHPAILLEASGNISLSTIEAYAATGVDAISSGAFIHQANWIDLSMKMD